MTKVIKRDRKESAADLVSAIDGLTPLLEDQEEEDFINRKVFPVVPPKVEYSITERGRRSIQIIESIRAYGLELMDEFKVEHKK